jgi:hypothetical protein
MVSPVCLPVERAETPSCLPMDACGSACRSGERICEPERQIIFRVPNGYIVDEKRSRCVTGRA